MEYAPKLMGTGHQQLQVIIRKLFKGFVACCMLRWVSTGLGWVWGTATKSLAPLKWSL